jgi:amino acid adenylation domain-containing protein
MMMNKKAGKDGVTGLEIAVIGMAGRFPGAGNIETFWENLENGIESICFFSDEELKTESAAADELLKHPNYIKACAVLDDIEYFDAPYFDYTPGEAVRMDPQVRIFHECAAAALEDAGYWPEIYKGPIGLFAGAGRNFTWEARSLLAGADPMEMSQFSDKDSLCTHVSYKLDLKGPASLVQTACSTSLTAVHQACRALLTGDCKIAIAGGVRAPVPQKQGYLYHEGMIMSPDGHSRAFDARVSGVVGGSGVAVVVLKLLKDALAHRDHIYAVIKGTAINNDGKRKVGYTAPSVEGQAEVIKTALRMARVEPETVSYVETHGTATPLGDMVEIEALKLAFNSNKKGLCAIGSVKTNVGHLDAAAGVTGLIKAILCLYHRMIPPSLHFTAPNPRLDLENSPFYVNNRLIPWMNDNRDYPLRAGVSSFGIGGTNVHVVLEEAPEPDISAAARPWKIIAWSAKTEEALRRGTRNLVEHFKKHPETNLANAAYTLHVGRKHHRCRQMAVCSDAADAVNVLSEENPARMKTFVARGENMPLVFMFPGQGSQYVNMGLGLYNEEPEFQKIMNHCFEILHALMGFDLKKILYPASSHSSNSTDSNRTPSSLAPQELPDLERYDINQPLMFAFEYALAKLLMSWGIMPTAMIGYSLGEYTAACLSGVFSLEDALELMVFRGRLMHEMPVGAMLSVPLPEEQLIPLLSRGKDGDISLAVVNEDACIVSGTPEAVRRFEEEIKTRRLMGMRVNVNRAGHSLILDSALQQFKERLDRLTLNKPQIPFVSGITGTWVKEEEVREVLYWVRHLRETIRFADGIKELAKDKRSIFVEVGPGRDMGILARRTIGEQAGERIISTIRQARKNEPDSCYLLRKIGQLWLYGVPIDWQAFYSPEKRFRIPLPTYSFDKRRYWLEEIPFSANLWNISTGEAAGAAPFTGKKSSLTDRTHLNMDSAYAAPECEIEKKLVNIWEKFFGVQRLGIDDDFFDLGGDSLKAMKLLAEVHKNLDVRIQMEMFFKHSTIRELSRHLENAAKDKYESIEPVEKKEYYMLSSAQKRLYFIQQMIPASTVYNIYMTAPFKESLELAQLEEIFKQIIQRHESFRTSFRMIEGEPVQVVHDEVEFEVEYFNLAARDKGKILNSKFIIQNSFIRPFDLSQAPLLRVGLIHTPPFGHPSPASPTTQQGENLGNGYILMVDMHHIISDASSLDIIEKEFTALRSGEQLPGLTLQYKDYCEWQNSEKQKKAIEKQQEYWLNTFAGELPILHLPLDYPRPAVQRFEGNTVRFYMSKEKTKAIKETAAAFETTLFMMLLAAYNILLSRLSGQEDIVVGIPIAGRQHTDLQHTIGMFVNTLALRNYPSIEKPFTDFLQEVKHTTTAAFENQDYPFEDLVERLGVNRDTSRNPVFDAAFNLVSVLELSGELPESEADQVYDHQPGTSKFDLTFTFIEIGGGLSFSIEYCTKLFKPDTIERFIEYFKKIVSHLLENPGVKLREIDILSEEEKNHLLIEFNQTESSYPKDKTIYELFEKQVERTPDSVAVVDSRQLAIGKEEKTGEPVQLTYRELNQKSDQLAIELKEKGVLADDIVAIMMARCIEMIIGIIGILKAGGAYLPIDPAYPQERINYMLKDSGAKILLTNSPEGHHFNCQLSIVNYQLSMNSPEANFHHSSLIDHHSGSLAYIIYTSGTTGRPKGTLMVHRSLVNLCYWHNNYYRVTENDHSTQYANFAFDASVWEIFPYLIKGAALHIIGEDIKLDIRRLADYYEKHHITISFLPTQLCQHFMEEADEIPSLRCLLTGGDRLNRFVERGYRLYNNYGPTENTVVTTSCLVEGYKENIPIGKPIDNSRVYILNKDNFQLQPLGVAGELCIGGDSLSRGYLNNPELTAEKFVRSVISHSSFVISSSEFSTNDQCPMTNDRLYRTGDLARWLVDGNIEFLGRIDLQVKIRGFRIEFGEIESRLQELEEITEAMVIPRDVEKGEKYLCAYIVTTREMDFSGLKHRLSTSLPDYMIPAYFVPIEKIPLTPSGKVDHRRLPEPEIVSGSDYAGPRDEIEEQMAEIWSEVLGIEKEKIGVTANFFELGGHSLKATSLVSRIHKVFNADIPLAMIFRRPTIRELAEQVSCASKVPLISIHPVEKKEYYPLSSAQKRMYVMQQIEPESITYNMPAIMILEGNINKKHMENTFRKLINRHESLRTSFEIINDHPVQRIHDDVDFEIEYMDFKIDRVEEIKGGSTRSPTAIENIIRDFIRPFDLSRVMQLRVALIKTNEEEHILVADMHHIISDGLSMDILIKDLVRFYSGETLPALKLHYKDFSQWQNNQILSGKLKKQQDYWLHEFKKELPIGELPSDYKRPVKRSFAGSSVTFMIPGEETMRLKELAQKEHTTMFMVLLALYNILLFKLSQQEDITVGTIAAGRRHPDLENIIGVFVNTLALRNYPEANQPFCEFLRKVRKRTLEAFDNQDYQFEDLVEQILIEREPGRNPIFDAAFSFIPQGIDKPSPLAPAGGENEGKYNLKVKAYNGEQTLQAKFDLLMTALDKGEELMFVIDYSTELFNKETIKRLTKYFKEIVSAVTANESIQLKNINISHELLIASSKAYNQDESNFDF